MLYSLVSPIQEGPARHSPLAAILLKHLVFLPISCQVVPQIRASRKTSSLHRLLDTMAETRTGNLTLKNCTACTVSCDMCI